MLWPWVCACPCAWVALGFTSACPRSFLEPSGGSSRSPGQVLPPHTFPGSQAVDRAHPQWLLALEITSFPLFLHRGTGNSC